jgi:REP element-mobilizing transposase RayT
MIFDPQKHHRRSIRLREYDYSQTGFYFITICVHERQCLFGEIINGQLQLNKYGEIAHNEWENTAKIRKNVSLDVFVIMPNHVHGIVVIHDNNRRGTMPRALEKDTAHHAPTLEQFGKPTSNSIPTIIRSYKATVTKQVNQLRNTLGAQFWQRNYYEHIIRNEKELSNIRQYIVNNPLHWDFDREHLNDKALEEKKQYWKDFFAKLNRNST